jgi:fermentation-respiration switch protein FrsA (DUF1100 family)/ADP-ribosylglycohydrolase
MSPYTRASLVADSLSLGPLWIYNQGKIARLYPDGVTTFTDPAASYHPKRKAGQLSHYGDQTILLAESLQKRSTFEAAHWREDWLAGMKAYDSYLDGATKDTLANNGLQPSSSNDLAGASRIGPIIDLGLSLAETVQAARQQTALTHGDPGVQDAAEFFVRALFALRDGRSMAEAFQLATSEGSYAELDVATHLESALKASADKTTAPLKVGQAMGLTCHLPEAFPLTLYFALRDGSNFKDTLSDNGLAGGDTSARGMLLGLLFEARDGQAGEALAKHLILSPEPKHADPVLAPGPNPVAIDGPNGQLSGVLELPAGETTAFALFAHCFTCGKDFLPEKRITQGLAEQGIATLRIDFSGLGKSSGDFSDSSFLTNLDDLLAAADWLREHHQAPRLLVGHSLGGAAVLAAASQISEVVAVATIGAPADPAHVTHLFENDLETIRQEGQAEVKLAGRSFLVGKRFLEDLDQHKQEEVFTNLRGVNVLIMHSPEDTVVPLENAGIIYSALKHPKSFLSLPGSDHLLTKPADAAYVARLIQVWSSRALG